MAEINLNFKQLDASSQWYERFQHLRRNHSIHSCNRHDSSKSKLLFGGTGQITMGTSTHRVLKSGADETGLGRWVWTLFAGKNNTKLRVISGYRPNPDASDRPGSVYSQQERYFRSNKDDRNPRRAFIKDLQKSITTWTEEGNLLIVGMDANDNIRTGDVHKMLRSAGLVDVHHSLHPHLSTESTCNINTQDIPVDGIWASPSLDCVAAGYYGYGELIIGNTDHRMIWADFAYESVFGFKPPDPVYIAPQRLTLDDPRVVRRYNKVLKQEHSRLRLRPQAFAIQKAVLTGLKQKHRQDYEKIAHLDHCARKHAAKKCRKLRMGAVPFSESVVNARGEIDMWSLLKRKREGTKASTKKIRRLMRRTGEMTAFQKTPKEIRTKRQAAISRWKKLKKNAETMRTKFGKQLIKARAKDRNTTVGAQEKQLKQAFGQRKMARRVKRITGKPRNTMSCVNAPTRTGEGPRTDCYDRQSIETACMEEGTRRFSQTESTPLMQHDFVTRVGYHAQLSGADEILSGTFVPHPDMDPYAVQFLEQLKMQDSVHNATLSKAISTAAYQESWRRMKPNTSSSPLGPRFVDYIAGSRDKEIAEFDATMANIPYASGLTPKAWTQMTDVLIPKKSHSSLVEKLRIIVLFHAMFNMNNKRIGREMVANAERLKQIPWEVYGGRKRHRALECATNKVLTMDIARLEHRSTAICSNDAKSCYDRILHAIASICMRRVGVAPETCKMMFGTLEQVDHYVRTNFGDSTTSYACIEIPFQGVYQGNGDGPGIWMLVSIPIINMLKARGFGFKVTNAMSNEKFSFVCYAFVDDTDLVHAPVQDIGLTGLVEEMQAVVDTWEGGLRASGGALVPDKSYWYLIHFTFQNNRWRYESIDENPARITIRDVSGLTRVELDRLEVFEARETLGVYIAMDGNQDTQMQALLQIAQRWADLVRSGRLTQAEAWFSLTFCIIKSLEYPLMATSLSQAQCDIIMTPILNAALPALGYNRKMPSSVVFGPRRFQGVGIPELWTLQGVLKLWLAVAHGDAPTITGCSLRALLALHTIELGMPGTFLQQDFEQFGHLASTSWLKHLWGFCSETNIRLEPSSPPLQLARENDEFLMQQFWKFGYRKTDLYHLNLCRLWCHSFRISDIATGDGLRIHPLVWNGHPPDDAGNDVKWTKHGRPTPKCWQLWQTALRSCFLTLDQPQQTLRRPLGKWVVPTTDNWHWFYSPSQDRVYHLQDTDQYQSYSTSIKRRRLRSPKYLPTSTTMSIPLDAERTTVSEQPTFVWCHGSSPSIARSPQSTQISDLIHANDQWAVRSFSCPNNGKSIADAISQGTAISVCDGSYKTHFGTAAYVIQDGDQREARILGANVTPGHPADQNPYRSEVAGIFAVVIIVEAITKAHGLLNGTIELACDCESGITAIFTHEYDSPSQPHYDLIHEIRKKISTSPIEWKYRHVRGHQDKHINVKLLDRWGQLNVEMDGLAKAYWNETYNTVAPFYPISSHGWSLWIGDRKLTAWDRNALYNHAQATDIIDHWSERRQIPQELIYSIDWESCEQAIKRLGLNKSLWVPKWLAGYAPVGKVMQRYQFQDHAECPRCSAFEDTLHVLQCPAPRARAQWEASVDKLEAWLIKSATMPALRNAILNRLQAWKTGDTTPAPSYSWPGVDDLVSAQAQVGWRVFLEGGLLKAWAAKQQEYYDWLSRRNTGKRWTTTLIKKLWEISWDMWEHRNGELHNPTSPAALREHARLDALITIEYQKTRTLVKKDRRWFRRPQTLVFTEAINYKLQWLESVTLARARYSRRQRKDLTIERKGMRNYLRPSH
jgi:hypothetical protein